jgi:DNA-binding NarL/FixJ family response regulator
MTTRTAKTGRASGAGRARFGGWPRALTTRERQILRLIWGGLKNKEIGAKLDISVKTVEAHRANMMKKVRVSNTAQLLRAAIVDGLLKSS